MAATIPAVAGVAGLALVLAGVLPPLVVVPIVVLAALPLAFSVLGRLFAHARPTRESRDTAPVPSTSEAAYDPVADPPERA